MFQTLEEIDEQIKCCNKCILCEKRKNTVCGVGNPTENQEP